MSTWLVTPLQGEGNPVLSSLLVLAGLCALLLGGHLLVRGSVDVAKRLGMSTLAIGLTVVAFGTSAPELAINIIAALGGNTDLSFGNVVGSNIANIGLALGLGALVAALPVSRCVLGRELPLVLAASIAMVLLAVVPGDGTSPAFGRLAAVVLLSGGVAVTWWSFRRGPTEDPGAALSEVEGTILGPFAGWVAVLGGLVLLVLGGHMAEAGSLGLTTWLGISQSFVGFSVVAIATSLPEITAVVVACRSRHTDLALGLVLGSNLYNILLVLGVTAVISPVAIPAWGWWDLGAMLVFTAVLFSMVMVGRRRISRRDGCILLLGYLAYLGFCAIREFA